jgi:rubrerythrin
MKKIIAAFALSLCAISDAQSAPLTGTQTELNLLTAFAGESMARDKYDFFASAANGEGLQSIGKIFTETANMEKEHGARFYKFLEHTDAAQPVGGTFDFGTYGKTADNLRNSIENEHHENSAMYLEMARVARTEGFDEIADDLEHIAIAEKYHEDRFRVVLTNLENKTFFVKAAPVRWKCTNCGYHTTAPGAPAQCPACEHPQGYFIEVRDEYM